MPNFFSYSLNGFALDMTNGIVVEKCGNPTSLRPATATTPGRDDEYDGSSYLAAVQFAVSGRLIGDRTSGDAYADYETKKDAFRAAIVTRARVPFYRVPGRYRMVKLTGQGGLDDDNMSVAWSAFDLTWRGSPFEEAETPTTGTLSTGGNSLSTAGTWETPLSVTAVVTAAPAGCSLTVSNAADKSFTYYPAATGTFTFDADAESVTDGTGADVIAPMDGCFIHVQPGAANAVTVTLAGGLTISSLTYSLRDRWV